MLDREPTAQERREHPAIARIDARVGYPAARAPADLPVVGHLLELAARAAGEPAIALPTLGGSVPLHHFGEVLGAPTVILPIANPDNNQHAADENLRLGNLWYGVDLFALLLHRPRLAAARRCGGRPGSVAGPIGVTRDAGWSRRAAGRPAG